MKFIFKLSSLTVVAVIFCLKSFSQTTIILLRHAEKDTTIQGSTTMNANPPLSEKGKHRAIRLMNELKNYYPNLIYSTDYIRTKSTIQPIAQKFKKEIILYNVKEQNKLADELLAMENKTIIVVGHSNTIPLLANMLMKQNLFTLMDDSDYKHYWIITIKNAKATACIKEY
ncbi:MAG: histidine phosphatase family protein [Bacteroidetes bacterium]|nr:histidine phosphatase family protein [Bacteroidota bacterium]MBS1648152.1 histidine phosphatase family protein [Bacteroidota bacterium]